jgi:outer membrane protein assembly factor BamD (BamD/ComL family)
MFPRSAAAPEALFLSGVCYFKRTHNPQPLKEAYEKLLEEYPASEWTSLAYPYRLL